MMSKEIKSVGCFLEKLNQECSRIQQNIKRANEIPEERDNEIPEDKTTVKWFFRGQCNATWKLLPSLFREIGSLGEIEKNVKRIQHSMWGTYFQEEQFLIQEAERFSPENFASCKNDISRMAVAQHYGIPTRLLDVSENALVALYFATESFVTEEEGEVDGKVFVFRTSAYDYKIASTGGKTKKVKIENYHVNQNKTNRKSLFMFDKPMLFFPPFVTARQKAQWGTFLFFENNKAGNVIEMPKNQFFGIKIPAASKKLIRDELETKCGISEGTLFPDGLASYKKRIVRDAEIRIEAELLLNTTT